MNSPSHGGYRDIAPTQQEPQLLDICAPLRWRAALTSITPETGRLSAEVCACQRLNLRVRRRGGVQHTAGRWEARRHCVCGGTGVLLPRRRPHPYVARWLFFRSRTSLSWRKRPTAARAHLRRRALRGGVLRPSPRWPSPPLQPPRERHPALPPHPPAVGKSSSPTFDRQHSATSRVPHGPHAPGCPRTQATSATLYLARTIS